MTIRPRWELGQSIFSSTGHLVKVKNDGLTARNPFYVGHSWSQCVVSLNVFF